MTGAERVRGRPAARLSAGEDPGLESFRERLREFVAEQLRREQGHAGGGASRLEWRRRFAASLFDAGLAGPAWPKRYGGMELPLAYQVAYHEEMAAARAPAHPAPTCFVVGPTLVVHGSEEQKDRFLRPMLRGDELWCQGFSEPDAGSDLFSLRTRAVRDGDAYVVTGRKVWTSLAHHADFMYALVRTGPPGSGARGLSYLLVDMHAEGVQVRPLRDMTGGHAFNEVVLEEVRVPLDRRVGAEGEGAAVAWTTLGHERSTGFVARSVRYRRVLADLVELVRRRGLGADPVVRQRLAAAETAVRLDELNGLRVLQAVMAGREPGPAASVTRLSHALVEQRLHELAVDVLGPYGTLGSDEATALDGGRFLWGFLRTRASTIGGGTAEVQRTTLGERVLGLPREPSPGPPRPAG